MLSFVGLGISGFESIPIEGLEAISKADVVYLEQFTSPIGKSDVDKIQNAIKGEFIPAKRWLVEDGKEILEKSKEIAGRYHKQALAVTPSFIINAINILGETDMNYKTSRNTRLHVELCLIKLASLQHAIDVTKKKSLG